MLVRETDQVAVPPCPCQGHQRHLEGKPWAMHYTPLTPNYPKQGSRAILFATLISLYPPP